MMNQFRTALILSKSIPRITLRHQAAYAKFGNDKLNMEVNKKDDKTSKSQEIPVGPNKTNLDTAKATSDAQKQFNKDQSMKEKYGMDAKNTDNSSFKNKDSTNTTSDANKSFGQNQNKDDKRSPMDQTKGGSKSTTDTHTYSKGDDIHKPGGYGGTESQTSQKKTAQGVGGAGSGGCGTQSSSMNTTSGTSNYGSGSGNTTGSGTSSYTAGTGTATDRTDTSIYETNTGKKSISEAIKDSTQAAKDAAKQEYYKDQTTTSGQDKYSHLGTEDRSAMERLKDSAKAAKDAAKETYNKERENYPSSSTTSYTSTTEPKREDKKDDHTIIDTIKDTAKAAMNTIMGQNATETTKEDKIKYEDPSTKGTPGGYKVDKERAENDTQKSWDPKLQTTDTSAQTSRTVYETDKPKSGKKDDKLPDVKDKGI